MLFCALCLDFRFYLIIFVCNIWKVTVSLSEMDWFTYSEFAIKATVVAYLAATGLYLLYLARRSDAVSKLAAVATIIGAVLHTIGLTFRWIEGGWSHPPFTNMYESLIFFAWGIAVFYLIVLWKYKLKSGGAFILPIALGAMGAAILNPASSKEIQDLMPALQSHWLHAHVAIAAMAYAAFVAAFGTSMMFLLKDKVERKYLGMAANIFMAFMLLVSDRLAIITDSLFTLNLVTAKGQVTGDVAPLTGPGRALLIAVIYFIIAAVLYYMRKEPEQLGEEERPGTILGMPYAPFVTMLGVLTTGIGLALLARASLMDPGQLSEMVAKTDPRLAGFIRQNEMHIALFGNPFKIIIICLVIFVGGAAVFMDMKLDWVREVMPEAKRLDNMSYMIITIAFPLMTMVIITGAVWAKYAFGEYWQWDPKETASLITWIIYTAYFHARMSLNWSPRRTAVISIIGFASVVFTYLGVNAIGTGYHAYASF